jgi:hypothetical protein
MKLRPRLVRLKQRLPAGCPACHHRCGPVALVPARKSADGSVAPGQGRPEPCARCGGVPERLIQIAEVVVKGREDVARLGDEGWSRSVCRPALTDGG